MTNRIDRLEQDGLVVRSRDLEDRRSVIVTLTAKGQELVDAAVIAHVANEARLLSGLTLTERGTFVGLLRTLLLSLEDHSHSSPEQR